MSMLKKNITIFCLVFFLSIFMFSNFNVKEIRKQLSANYSLDISSMPPDAIKIMAGEFAGLMADYILLQMGAFLGSNIELNKTQWEMVLKGFQQVFALDPRSQSAYLQAQGHLAWEGKKIKETIDLLKISRDNRPNDFFPGTYIGFDYYYFLKDFENASNAFLKAAEIKGAAVILALLGTRFAIKEKRIQTSIDALTIMLNDQVLDDNSKKEIENRIQTLKAVEILNQAVDTYKQLFYLPPDPLDELVTYGIIAQLPENPYGKKYTYNPSTGEILFD
ncbi:MAG: hypothetical protein GY729_03250 [Desulfobacteraceae bacterium]|nr:hypothetical protein [Desulfobacteraceae bacterium]